MASVGGGLGQMDSGSRVPAHPLESKPLAALVSAPHLATVCDATLPDFPLEPDPQVLSTELEAARTIQESFLPKTFPSLPGFQLAGYCQSARHVGGDFYDAVSLSKDCVLLVIADVMGKGVPAALFASTLRTLLRAMTQWTQHPADMLSRINAVMFEELSNVNMFITVQLAVADAVMGSLTVASAGHHALLYSRAEGEAACVAPKGMPLGISLDCTFSEVKIPLSLDTRALLYTDGVSEARNARGDCFGQERISRWLADVSRDSKCTGAQLRDSLARELRAFQGGLALSDDQTFLLLSPSEASKFAIAESAQASAA